MEEKPVEFLAKANCKTCFGRGLVVRTYPKSTGDKKMYTNKTLCHCATDIKTPEPGECVVPIVKTDEPKQYASTAQPLH